MGKRIIFLFLSIIMLSAFASAGLTFGYGNDNKGLVNIPSPSVSVNYTVVNTNSSLFWRNLGVPTEIPNSQFWYNQTTPSIEYTNTKTNSTFNQTLTDSIYASSTNVVTSVTRGFGFNLTGTSITSTGTLDVNRTIFDLLFAPAKWDYNQTTASNNYCDGQIGLNETRFLSTFNTTYHNLFVQNNTWNSLFIGSLNNVSYLSTFNTTYEGFTSFNLTNFRNNLTDTDCVAGNLVIGIQTNGTVLCAVDQQGSGGGLPYNQQLNTTSNVTFNNFTITANSVFQKNITADYYKGNLNASTFPTSTCTGTDKVVSIGSNGLVTCGTDQTGAGSGDTSNTYMLKRDYATTNLTKFNATLFEIPVLANANYSIKCRLFTNSSLTTVGVQFNMSVPASPTQFEGVWNSPTTTTAPLYTSCYTIANGGGTATSCVTAQTAAPINGYHYFDGSLRNGVNAGYFNLTMKSEVAGTVLARHGSYCSISAGAF